MSMKQNIEIDGKQVPFKASAAIPRIYRMRFHRDIYKDLRSLEKSVGDGSEYPVTSAPASSSILHSHVPLKPVCPVTKTFFPR